MREFKPGLISSDKLLKSRLFNRIKHRCFAGLKTLFTLAGLTLALALALTPVTAQAQSTDEGLSEGAVSSLLSKVQERPISLFLGLLCHRRLRGLRPRRQGRDLRNHRDQCPVCRSGAGRSGLCRCGRRPQPVAQPRPAARRTSYWTDRPSVIDAEALTLEVSIEQRKANFERIAGSNLRFADASDPGSFWLGQPQPVH